MKIYRYKDGFLNRGYLVMNSGHYFDIIEPLGKPSRVKGSGKPIVKGRYPFYLKQDKIELKEVPNRNSIQIHVGNFPSDSTGCILPGLRKSVKGVLHSRLAMKVILNIIKKNYKKEHYYVEII